MDLSHIQNVARDLQLKLWQNRDLFTQRRELTHIEILQPAYAAHILGLDYQEVTSLGESRFGREKFKPAGIIDFGAKRIHVTTEFSPAIRRFTAAHEIGHWLLHQDSMPVMHRDMPIDGSKQPKSPTEQEANYFAACFLMPIPLLKQKFELQFGIKGQFIFNETTCFHLGLHADESLLYASQDSLDRELALARSTYFNGTHMHSLATQFGVSNSAMALRIKEIGLVRWP